MFGDKIVPFIMGTTDRPIITEKPSFQAPSGDGRSSKMGVFPGERARLRVSALTEKNVPAAGSLPSLTSIKERIMPSAVAAAALCSSVAPLANQIGDLLAERAQFNAGIDRIKTCERAFALEVDFKEFSKRLQHSELTLGSKELQHIAKLLNKFGSSGNNDSISPFEVTTAANQLRALLVSWKQTTLATKFGTSATAPQQTVQQLTTTAAA